MRIICCIQARMDSARFTGKVLADLAGHPILAHVVTRCQMSRLPVVVATTIRQVDDPIAAWAYSTTLPPDTLFRWNGLVEDVLGRYIACADAYEADAIIRVTGDSPFVPIEVIETVSAHLRSGCQVAALTSGFGGVPDGWEAEGACASLLRLLDADLPSPYEREHVFPGIYSRIVGGKRLNSIGTTIALRPFDRWTDPWLLQQKFSVDTPADLEWLRQIADRIDCTPPRPTADALRGLLHQHPEMQRAVEAAT